MKTKTEVIGLKKQIINYVYDNIKEYILILLLFIIGIFAGVMIINSTKEGDIVEVENYISDFVVKFKGMGKIDNFSLLINSIKNNVILAFIIWLAGTTVIGLPVVLITVLFRGLCLGYTISAITYTLGKLKGLQFCIIGLFIQNILFIPALISLGVSSIKLYKAIIKDRQKENIKIQIIRHSIFSGVMLIVLIMSSFIENTVSIYLLKNMVKFF